jgi:hypothetical protein
MQLTELLESVKAGQIRSIAGVIIDAERTPYPMIGGLSVDDSLTLIGGMKIVELQLIQDAGQMPQEPQV